MAKLWHTEFTPRALSGDGSPGYMSLRNRLMAVFHGYFKQNPGKIAIYVDRTLKGIRVFSQSIDDLVHFVDAVKSHFVVRDYYAVGFPDAVDTETFSGEWISLQGYNIPNRKSDSLNAQGASRRDTRIAMANKEGWEFFILRSQSNQTLWSESIRPVPQSGFGSFEPNSYGISRPSRPVALPVLPRRRP
jgi:hypothetical protein